MKMAALSTLWGLGGSVPGVETSLAAQIAAHIGSWTVSAYSVKAAVLKVNCRSQWVGCITVVETDRRLELDAVLRHKEKAPAPVFQCTIRPMSTSDAAAAIFRKIYYHFYPMQLDTCVQTECPPWHCGEYDALYAASHMACSIHFCRVPVVINMSNGWYVVAFVHCHVDVRYHRSNVTISCAGTDQQHTWIPGENSAIFMWMIGKFKTILGPRCQCLLHSS